MTTARANGGWPRSLAERRGPSEAFAVLKRPGVSKEDRIGENYFARHDPRHRWHFYPHVTRDEALLIKQWDSAGTLARTGGGQGDATDADAPCTFSFHSAFVDPSTPPDAPDRWSIEVRCAVLFD